MNQQIPGPIVRGRARTSGGRGNPFSWVFATSMALSFALPAAVATITAQDDRKFNVALTASSLLVLLPLLGLRWGSEWGGDAKRFLRSKLFLVLVAQLLCILIGCLQYEISGILRVCYIIGFFATIILLVPRLTEQDLKRGLVLFAIMEGVFCFLPVISINTNGLTVRVITVGIVLFLVLRQWYLRVIGIGVAIAGVVYFEGRTAAMAIVGTAAVIAAWYITKRQRWAFTVAFLICLGTCAYIFTSEARVISLLGALSDNLVEHVSKGRSDKFVFDDPLGGRMQFWDLSKLLINERPYLGHGPGFAIGDFNVLGCHNAYLRLGVEFGLVGGGLTLAYYVLALWILTGRELRNTWGTNVAVTLCVFMFFVGLLEAIGMGSMFTPANLIFHFLLVYVVTRKTDSVRLRSEHPQMLGSRGRSHQSSDSR